METELLETFEAAKKAAEAAEDDRGSSEVDRCVDALRRLKKMPVTTKDLVATQVLPPLHFMLREVFGRISVVAVVFSEKDLFFVYFLTYFVIVVVGDVWLFI